MYIVTQSIGIMLLFVSVLVLAISMAEKKSKKLIEPASIAFISGLCMTSGSSSSKDVPTGNISLIIIGILIFLGYIGYVIYKRKIRKNECELNNSIEAEESTNINKVHKAKKRNVPLIIGSISIIFILIIIYFFADFLNYPNKLAPDYELESDSITVLANQKDRIRLKKSSMKYRIKSATGDYGEWQDDNKFSNLNENVYFVQTSIVDNNNNYTISDEIEVHMYIGELIKLNETEVATMSGGIYTIPYYEFEQKHTHTEKCPKSGMKAGVWGDSNLSTCSLCGAEHVAIRTEQKEKYTTWNGQTAYRDIYNYTEHKRTVTTTEYNYTHNKDEGIGNLVKTYYSRNNNNISKK